MVSLSQSLAKLRFHKVDKVRRTSSPPYPISTRRTAVRQAEGLS